MVSPLRSTLVGLALTAGLFLPAQAQPVTGAFEADRKSVV